MTTSIEALSDENRVAAEAVIAAGHGFLAALPDEATRELSLARTKLDEAVLWAVEHIRRR